MGLSYQGTMEGTHPLIDVLIHLVIYVTVCNASNVCWLLMSSEPLKMPVFQIQEKLTGRQTTNAQNTQHVKGNINSWDLGLNYI